MYCLLFSVVVMLSVLIMFGVMAIFGVDAMFHVKVMFCVVVMSGLVRKKILLFLFYAAFSSVFSQLRLNTINLRKKPNIMLPTIYNMHFKI